jgi:hypothetical protein
MTPDVRTVRARKGQIGAYRAAFVYQGPFKKALSTASRVVNEVVLKKCNSTKFKVASNPSNAAVSNPERHGSTTSEPKRGDQVAFVAPLCIKGLRLVTLQLPENFSPIGPGLSDDREMAT